MEHQKERLAAALVAPDGRVVKVIAIARATDIEIKAAQHHAAGEGFTLVVQEEAPFCCDDEALHSLIAAEGRP